MARRRNFGKKQADGGRGMLAPIHFPVMGRVDERTPDGRLIHGEGFGARELPLPLLYQRTQSGWGHEGAVVAGRLDFVQVGGDGTISGDGWFIDDDEGRAAHRLVATQSMRQNSIDLLDTQVEVKWDLESDDLFIDFLQANIGATTLVSKPAFADAHAETERVEEDLATDQPTFEPVTFEPTAAFSITDLGAPVGTVIPSQVFAEPDIHPHTPITFDADRVMGYLALWESMHHDRGVRPPRSRSGYAFFHTGEIQTDTGVMGAGRLVFGGGHAEGHLSMTAAAEHYANTSRCWADVRVGENRHGIWFSGITRPGLSDDDRREVSNSVISGDWRRVGGGLELIVGLSVNAGGFPVPRRAFSNGTETALTGAFVTDAAPLVVMHESPLIPRGELTAAISRARGVHEAVALADQEAARGAFLAGRARLRDLT